MEGAKVIRLSMQIHISWWNYCAAQHCHTSQGKSLPSVGMIAHVLGRISGRCPSGLDSKYLGAWKGPHLFGCILSHLLHSEFLQGKGDGGKTTGRASLPAVRKVMVKLTWALLGDVPEPREASSLVLPLTYLQWDCIQIHIHFGLEIIQKAWPFLLSQGFSLRTRNMPTWSFDFVGDTEGEAMTKLIVSK